MPFDRSVLEGWPRSASTEPREGPVVYLLTQLSRWQGEGLLEAPVLARLRARIFAERCPLGARSDQAWATRAAAGPRQAAPPAPPPVATARVAAPALLAVCDPLEDTANAPLVDALEAAARELLAADPPPEPTFDAALAAEVSFVEQIDERVQAERARQQQLVDSLELTPAAARELGDCDGAAQALLEAAAASTHDDSVSTALLEHDLPPGARGRWSRLKPLLQQNALWLAGGLLVLFGSLYFLRTLWDLSSLLWYGAVAFALHGYAAAFFAVGYLLARRREAYAVGRILYCFTLVLLPLASVATGELVALLLQRRGAVVGLALLAMALALALQGTLIALIAGLYERASIRPLAGTGLAFAAQTMLVAPLLSSGLLGAPITLARWSPLALAAGVASFAIGLWAIERARVHLREALLLTAVASLWALLVLVGRLHFSAPLPTTHYAPLLSLLALLLLHRDARLLRRAGMPPRLGGVRLVLHGMLLAGPLLALTGLLQRGYFDTGARVVVLLATLPAVLGFAGSAVRHGRRLPTFIAAGLGLLGYFFLPAPFHGLLLWAQGALRDALGYAHQPLPLAYYGLTFLPYFIACLALAARLRSRRPDLARDLQLFVFALGVLLLPLACSAAPDLRPMLWTWPVYALMAVAAARLFERPFLRVLAQGLLLLWVLVLGAELWQRGLPLGSPLAAGYGLACALAALRAAHPWRLPLHLGALGGALLTLPLAAFGPWLPNLTPSGPTALALIVASVALVLSTLQLRRRLLAQIVPWAVVLTVGVGLSAAGATASTAGAVFLLLALTASVVVQALESHRAGPLRELLAQPAFVLMVLAALATLALTWDGSAIVACLAALLVASLALLLVLQVFERAAVVGAGALFVLGLGVAARALHPAAAAPFVAMGGVTMLALAAWLSPLAANGEQRRATLLGLGHLAALAGLVATAGVASAQGAVALTFGFGAAALYLAIVTVLRGRRWTAELAGLSAVAALLTAGATLGWAREGFALSLSLLAVLASEFVRRFGWHGRPDPLYRLLAAPAGTSVAVAATLASLLGAAAWPVPSAIFGALAAVHLAFALRSAWAAAFGGLALAGAVARLVALVHAPAWIGALAVMAPALLLAAPSVFAQQPDERYRRWALNGAAVVSALVALLSALLRAGDTTPATPWLLHAALGGLLFAAWAAALTGPRLAVAALSLAALAGSAVLATALELWTPRSSPALHLLLLAAAVPCWLALASRLRAPWLQRRAGAIAATLAIVALVPLAMLAVFCLAHCERWLGPLAIGLLGGPWQVAGATLAVLFALALVAWRQPRLRGLLPLALIGGAAMLAALAAPGSHATRALVLAAGVLWFLRRWPLLARAGEWALGSALMALVASHGHLRSSDPALALLAITLLLAAHARERAERWWVAGWATGVALTAQAMTLFVAAWLSTGRYAPSCVAAFCALSALGSAIALLGYAERRNAPTVTAVARWTLGAVLPLAALALIGGGRPAPALVQGAALAALAFALPCWLYGVRRGRVGDGRLAMLTLLLLYLLARLLGPLADFGVTLDVVLVVLAGPLALGWGARSKIGAAARTMWREGATLLPLAAVVVLPTAPRGLGALLALLVGAHYAAAARLLANKHLAALALAFGNLALYLSWSELGWSSPLLIIVPLGLTLLTLLHVYEGEVSPSSRSALRVWLLVGLYGSSVAVACSAVSPLHALTVVPSLCVAGIVTGTLLRLRIYLVLGVVFLAVDLVANMLRYGLASRALGALFLTGLGLLLVTAMVIFNLEKERILRRYSSIVLQLRGWD